MHYQTMNTYFDLLPADLLKELIKFLTIHECMNIIKVTNRFSLSEVILKDIYALIKFAEKNNIIRHVCDRCYNVSYKDTLHLKCSICNNYFCDKCHNNLYTGGFVDKNKSGRLYWRNIRCMCEGCFLKLDDYKKSNCRAIKIDY